MLRFALRGIKWRGLDTAPVGALHSLAVGLPGGLTARGVTREWLPDRVLLPWPTWRRSARLPVREGRSLGGACAGSIIGGRSGSMISARGPVDGLSAV